MTPPRTEASACLLQLVIEEFATVCASILRGLPEERRDTVFTRAFDEALRGHGAMPSSEMLGLVLDVLRAGEFPALMYLGRTSAQLQ